MTCTLPIKVANIGRGRTQPPKIFAAMKVGAPSAALRSFLLAFAAAGAAAAGSGATPTAGETEGQLRQRLLQNYGDRATRPGEAAYSLNGLDTCAATIRPEDVEVQLYIESYQPIDSQKETWGFVAYTRVWWNDVRLSYNGTADGGCTDELHLDPADLDKIWVPVFYWEKAKKIDLPEANKKDRGELVHVYPSGRVWWSSQAEFTISCSMADNMDALPFDRQKCNFLMGMYSDSDARVAVRWKGYDPNDPSAAATAFVNWDGTSTCMADWHAYKLLQQQVTYDYVTSTYTYAYADVYFARTPNVWMQTYMIPALLLVVLSYALAYTTHPPQTHPALTP